MKWTFGIEIFGVGDEIQVEAPTYERALTLVSEALENELGVSLYAVKGDMVAQQQQVIAEEHKPVIVMLPRYDLLTRSERVSRAIQAASKVWKG